MKFEIKRHLESLGEAWQPIVEQSVKYFDQDGYIREDGTIQIFKRPWVAPLNYGIIYYPPTHREYFQVFKQRTQRSIPSFYQDILLQMNGCFVYDFTLFGLTPSIYSKGVLDRSQLQPFDLGTANTYWIKEYKVDQNLFHIGGRACSFEENIGYFLDGNNSIVSIRKNGERLGQWTTFQDFLAEEISAAEKMMLEERE